MGTVEHVRAADLQRGDVIVAERGEWKVDRVVRDVEKRRVYATGADGSCGYFYIDFDATCTIKAVG